jgi:hypothetical protein
MLLNPTSGDFVVIFFHKISPSGDEMVAFQQQFVS